jgi:hypothetical protein
MSAHVGIPGWGPFVAMALFLVGAGAAVGGYWVARRRGDRLGRVVGVLLGAFAVGCLAVGTALPLLLHASVTVTRPSTTARLQILSPTPGEAFQGDPATIPVAFRLEGGRIVAVSSLHLVPNEGHIHLYMDGSLVTMSGLQTEINASPGLHTLRAEFVAIDHGPFRPRVVATATFQVLSQGP